MNSIVEIFRKTFADTLDEKGFAFQYDVDNMLYFITHNNTSDRITTAKLIVSELVIERIHGSKNNTDIKSIGYFNFQLPSEGKETDFYVFAFSNTPDKKVEFVVITCTELINRLDSKKCNTNSNQETELKFWLLPDNLVFDTTNFGAEGEWWFVGGRMAENTNWDYTPFLNGWDQLVQS